MGREAVTQAEVGRDAGEVRVQLEAREMILRGDIRRRYALADVLSVGVEDEVLHFVIGGEIVRLSLGAETARKWAEAMLKPPPSLAQKLGLSPGRSVWLLTPVGDPVLVEAVDEAAAEEAQADMALAVVESDAALEAVLTAHGRRPDIALWLVYPKGGKGFGEASVRRRLRDSGYRDSKSCAVSELWTATRYALPKA
jgi:hypothetical protein